ncbi:MAG TPA: sulfur carrier protein ThiS [Burkholderiaceae bacterium]|nr:sulfur carrier protein ThiS [Burkholderiaceae bacterium]
MTAAAPVITVRLDGHDHPVPAGTTLAALVLALGHEPEALTTAVNGEFVPRHARDSCLLRCGDAVLFFHPIVGG